ncbi:hypothetical protein [Epilithonimonas zeae]|uniref:hypothetical protein n=1 Tax=Epilithonimonas zeae TaxID=1416779 RepID=UPI00200E375D|nr:hypothetical protein [Epilithonimonas zeae]UQB68102.1 hypothetical protein KI430_13840 [Epilithonimonas zeae]
MKNLKWFWRINYIITLYSLVLLSGEIVDSILGYDKNGYSFTQKYSKYYMIGNNDFISVFFFCIEWLQITLVLIILIWKKQERTKWNWLYFILLMFLALVKILFYFVAALGFATGEA